MKETFRVCPVCENKFPRNSCAKYCSIECGLVANRVLKASESGYYAELRQKRYAELLQYAEKNKLKKILKKYKPDKK